MQGQSTDLTLVECGVCVEAPRTHTEAHVEVQVIVCAVAPAAGAILRVLPVTLLASCIAVPADIVDGVRVILWRARRIARVPDLVDLLVLRGAPHAARPT